MILLCHDLLQYIFQMYAIIFDFYLTLNRIESIM